MTTYAKVEARRSQHAVGDKRPPTAYAVLVGGKPVGRVESRSTPNMVRPRGLRYYTGQRGFSREWVAIDPTGQTVGWSHTRGGAAARLTT